MQKIFNKALCLSLGLSVVLGAQTVYADTLEISTSAVVKDFTNDDIEELIPMKEDDSDVVVTNSKEDRLKAEKNYDNDKKKARRVSFSAPAPSISNASVMDAFYRIVAEKGLTESEINGWAYIIKRESDWNVTARNSSSGAYGLPQALPGRKMASHGSDWQTNPYTQLSWMYDYMVGRYGSIQGAVNFWNSHKWY